MFRLLVVGQIVAHHLAHVEIVAQLERQHRVENLFLTHLRDIFLRAQLVGILMIVRYASAKHDGFQVQRLAQVLAVFIHTAGEAQSAVLRMDKHLYTIENIAVGIVGAECLVARHLCVSVVVFNKVVVDNQRQGAAHNFVVDNRYNLTLRKNVDQFLYLSTGPKHIAAVGVYARERLRQLFVILHLKIANQHFIDFNRIFHSVAKLQRK